MKTAPFSVAIPQRGALAPGSEAARRLANKAADTWLAAPPVASALPLRMPRGHRISHLTAHCLSCKDAIPQEDFHGTVAQVLPEVISIDAVGYCRKCHLLTEFFYRFRETKEAPAGLYAEYINASGRWVRQKFEVSRGGPLAVLRRVFARIAGRCGHAS